MRLLMFGRLLQMVSPERKKKKTTLTIVGLYEQQDADQVDHNLRGKFVTDAEGKYSFYCLRPTPYPVSDAHPQCFTILTVQVPGDGPAGKLLDLMDRHHYRPAHIHLIVSHHLPTHNPH